MKTEIKDKITRIPVIFQNIKEYEGNDDRFLKIKIWLMHTGINHNYSSFSKEVVNKAIPSLANTPLLAFIEENSEGEQDFSDHRIVLHRTEDGEYDFKYKGDYIGVIPESNNAKWETRVSDSGELLEYLTVEALMWTKKDEPVDIMKRKGFTSQSMELADIYTGEFDKDGVFHFESFSFFGACLLGDDVLPAMQNSTAELQFSQDKAQKTIEEKLQEFNTLFSQGGDSMTEKVVKDYEKDEVVFDEEEVKEEAAENTVCGEGCGCEEGQCKDTPEDAANSTDDSEQADDTKFEDSPEESTDTQNKPEDVETDEEDEDKVDFEAKFNETHTELEDLKDKYTKLMEKLSELESYKRQREEDDIKAKFEGQLSEEEFNQLFEEHKDAGLDVLEREMYALIGMKNFSMNSTKTKEVNKISIVSPKEDYKPYGGFFD